VDTRFALVWALVGLGACLLLYFNHDRIWNDAALPRPPEMIRQLLRRGDGSLRATAVAVELWGLTQVVIGMCVVFGIASVRAIVAIGFASTLAVMLVIVVIDLSRRGASR
jgi:hypothetical protein